MKIIIIGAGPGGYETALLAAKRGVEVVLVEAGHVGGTCLNEGCIPTKSFCRNAEVLDGLRDASPEDVLKGVMKAVKHHRGSAPQSDDITMLCFRRTVTPKA